MKTQRLYFCLTCFLYGVLGPTSGALPNFDRRLDAALQQPSLDPQRQVAADQLKARIPNVRIDLDAVLSLPAWIINTEGFLSGPDFMGAPTPPPVPGRNIVPLLAVQTLQNDRHRVIKQFLDGNVNFFGYGSEILQRGRLAREFVGAHNGMRTVVWEQQLDGIRLFEAILIGHVTKDGELVALTSQFIANAEQASGLDAISRFNAINQPTVAAMDAIAAAADVIEVPINQNEIYPINVVPEGSEKAQSFGSESFGNVHAQLCWLPTTRSNLRLCWRVFIMSGGEAFQVLIDADTGGAWLRQSMTESLSNASYRVFTSDSPTPLSPAWSSPTTNQPSVTNRFLVVTNAVSTNASPNGWIDDGENRTIGNNVDVFRSWCGCTISPTYNENPLSGGVPLAPRAEGSPSRVFDFALDLSQDPTNNWQAAAAQVFYWCNWMHDKLYDLGFTEAAGNFQWTNFNRGGLQRDPVQINVQNLRLSTVPPCPTPCDPQFNNALFFTPPDGESNFPPRMVLLVYDSPAPDRDVAFDTHIILHEYTHGLSNRRVGGGNGGAGISHIQSRGMGEGWSDFYSLAMLSDASEPLTGTYPRGCYANYHLSINTTPVTYLDENYYYGNRRYPYSTDMTKNPLTFKDIDAYQASDHPGIPRSPKVVGGFTNAWEVHNSGEVWCAALWEMRANLIENLGFTNGNQLSLQLVTDGMNLTPPNPTFLQARDAILLADRVYTNGADFPEIWQGFAKRGMGYSAASSSSLTNLVVEAFDIPATFGNGWAWTFQTSGSITSSPAIGADGTVYVGSSDGKLYAIKPDGTQKWQFNVGGACNSSPSVGSDQTVYIGSANSNLFAINPDGTGKWTNNLAGAIFSSPSLFNDDTVYVGTLAGKVYALGTNGVTKTGWPYSTGGAAYSSPAVATNGTVFIGSNDGYLYALNTNGSLQWSVYLAGGVFSSPAIGRGGTIYVGSDDGKLYAVNPNGTIKWSSTNTGSSVRSSPAISDLGLVYVGSQNGNLYSVETNSGSANWVFTTGGSIQSAPAVGWDETVFVGSADGKLYAIATNGFLVWTQSLGGSVISSPVIGENGMLYVGSANSNVYAFHVPTLLASSSWPSFRGNLRHTGGALSLQLRPAALTPSNLVFYVNGQPGSTNLVQSSTNLTNWTTIATTNLPSSGTLLISSACSNVFYRAQSLDGKVRSFSALGHTVVYAPTGLCMIANHLNNPGGNAVSTLIPGPPEGAFLYKWDDLAQAFVTNRFSYGSWSSANMTLNPGEGAFFYNPTNVPFVLTFVGEVPQGYLMNRVTNGCIRSSIVPQSGPVDTLLQYPVLNGDTLYRFNPSTGGYTCYDYSAGTWGCDSAFAPAPSIGESLWIYTGTARNWTRRFSVWP